MTAQIATPHGIRLNVDALMPVGPNAGECVVPSSGLIGSEYQRSAE